MFHYFSDHTQINLCIKPIKFGEKSWEKEKEEKNLNKPLFRVSYLFLFHVSSYPTPTPSHSSWASSHVLFCIILWLYNCANGIFWNDDMFLYMLPTTIVMGYVWLLSTARVFNDNLFKFRWLHMAGGYHIGQCRFLRSPSWLVRVVFSTKSPQTR